MFAISRDTRQEYNNYLYEYKTTASKKGAMTRQIKGLVSELEAVRKAYENRGNNVHGWLHGNKIFKRDLRVAEDNLKLGELIKSEL